MEKDLLPELDYKMVDATDMAGDTNLYVPMVGQVFLKRVTEVLVALQEPGVLEVDFGKVGHVDSSTLVIAIAKALDLNQKKSWNKTIICTHTLPAQKTALESAIIVGNYLFDVPGRQLLLLVSNRDAEESWQILGQLSHEHQRKIWDQIMMLGCIGVAELASLLEQDKETVTSNLQVFYYNRLVVEVQTGAEPIVCAMPKLLTFEQRRQS